MKTNPEDPAFPSTGKVLSGISEYGGLTKREYFAALAMQGYLASGRGYMHIWAVEEADALIAELNK